MSGEQPPSRPRPPTALPADDHVHSQFSWDASAGDLAGTCARAVALGLPAVSFTEHVDLTAWTPPAGGWDWTADVRGRVDDHGRFLADPLEVDAYLAELERCRGLFPGLRIRSGIELSEGHWHPDAAADLLRRGFDRVVGSVHSLADLAAAGAHREFGHTLEQRSPLDAVRAYLAEVSAMARASTPFDVLGHLDYPLRYWPTGAGPVPWDDLEPDVRDTLGVLAASGRALEVNTSLPMDVRLVRWWHEAGGDAVAFGSDAHSPDELARGFRAVAGAVAAVGFRPGDDPTALWGRA
ncbi:PHP domain-containing protein [Kineococcus sp. R8]|uniref:PHP domain-containing protein n=1 Tax=Kineococcus siccus TaxID=2696567 RepID=UPI001411B4C6|nr:PHP domain-containing protein [Kineococcus siccus]